MSGCLSHFDDSMERVKDFFAVLTIVLVSFIHVNFLFPSLGTPR